MHLEVCRLAVLQREEAGVVEVVLVEDGRAVQRLREHGVCVLEAGEPDRLRGEMVVERVDEVEELRGALIAVVQPRARVGGVPGAPGHRRAAVRRREQRQLVVPVPDLILGMRRQAAEPHVVGGVDERVREAAAQLRRAGRQPVVERLGRLRRVARVRAEHVARREVHAVGAPHHQARARVDDRVVDRARRHRREHAPAEPGAVAVLVERQRGAAAVRERGRPLGAAAAPLHADPRAADRRIGALGAHGRLDRVDREVGRGRAGDPDQAAGRRHGSLQLRVGGRDPAVALLPRQVLDAAGARAARQAQAVEVAAVEAEDPGVFAHVPERDAGGGPAARSGEEAVQLRDSPRRAGARLGGHEAEAPEPLAQRRAARVLPAARPRVEVAPLGRVRDGRRRRPEQRRGSDERAQDSAYRNGGRRQDGASSERARAARSRRRGSRMRVIAPRPLHHPRGAPANRLPRQLDSSYPLVA